MSKRNKAQEFNISGLSEIQESLRQNIINVARTSTEVSLVQCRTGAEVKFKKFIKELIDTGVADISNALTCIHEAQGCKNSSDLIKLIEIFHEYQQEKE